MDVDEADAGDLAADEPDWPHLPDSLPGSCAACGWVGNEGPASDEEPPLVRGALDAQAEAETKAYRAQLEASDAKRSLATERAAVDALSNERDQLKSKLEEERRRNARSKSPGGDADVAPAVQGTPVL